MKKTPIFDFVKKYAESGVLRMHMPGHKGMGELGAETYDITEISGADVLYRSDGIIKESEQNASEIFGSAATLYSTEGSSLSIRAMVYLVSVYARSLGKRPVIAAARNAHRAFFSAAAISDVDVVSVYPKSTDTILSCCLEPDDIELFLSGCTTTPTAVYITSPDYLGNIAEVQSIAKICHNHGVLLLVDNAHGAYLRFLPKDQHPISLGADIVCDSAHKTLPVLTGGGYLHISRSAPEFFFSRAEDAMAFFASTSPSYLTLSSLDLANKYLTDNYRRLLCDFAAAAEKTKKILCETGYTLIGSEPLKLSVSAAKFGYTGTELADILRKHHSIECEFADPDFIVLMLSPGLGSDSLTRIENALGTVKKRPEKVMGSSRLVFLQPRRKLSVREAMFAPYKNVPVKNAEGMIFASAAISCPPAISPVIAGEVIDENIIGILDYYNIDTVNTVLL